MLDASLSDTGLVRRERPLGLAETLVMGNKVEEGWVRALQRRGVRYQIKEAQNSRGSHQGIG